MHIALELPSTVDAPARARKALRDFVRGLDTIDRWRAELIVTELVTNAVLYGPGGPVELALECGGHGLRGQVADPGQGIRRGASRNPLGEGGRGLFIVDQLSDEWGTSDGASRIWFEVAARA